MSLPTEDIKSLAIFRCEEDDDVSLVVDLGNRAGSS